MVKEIIRDKAGNPISVLLDYKQWLQIEQLLKQQDLKIKEPANPLDWYRLTESANAILNELIAYVGRERFLELKKETPDKSRIEKLIQFSEEIRTINRNSDNFKDLKIMEQIVALYGPKLKRVNNGEQLV
ncbi:MAG: hypothetical protein BGO31_20660 [Bacteroidetes bacterium 43-16]|uniref:hypothetical protein n=1 Tax=uncultured Dysgonomonas sp. TaxID=206096 RepID=UPI00092AEA6D|nr:hypothetical protein [uncultured Dysgonomonas sp.]OJV55344.1 MAG: hypothetical protein BGO31_20660 [Bacteroidetes bacterium 43-16]